MARAKPTGPAVNVLVYHSISTATGSPRFCCEPQRFAQHLRWLRAMRLPVLPLEDFLRLLWQSSAHAGLRRALLLTFDDGYRDFAEEAWPLLRDRGLPAVLFVVAGPDTLRSAQSIGAGSAGGRSIWPDADPWGSALLSASEIRDLARDGVAIGAHGWSHRPLSSTSPLEARQELSEARSRLAEIVGQPRNHSVSMFRGHPISTLAYPYGEANPVLRSAARDAGYLAAFTTSFGSNGPGSDPFALRRAEVRGDDGLLSFVVKARFGCSLRQLLWSMARSRRPGSRLTIRNREEAG